MLDYFRDPAWQFVGAILALIAIVATVLVHLIQRQRKRLAYEVVSRNELLTVKEELENKLQILFDGQPARDICLIVVRISNIGNVAISSSDYERNIVIGTGTTSKILSAAVTEIEPENLVVDIVARESTVQINPTLLNPKDSISLKILVSDFSGRIVVDARILGVKKIEKAGARTGVQAIMMVLALILMLVGIFMLDHFDPKPAVKPPMPIGGKIGGGLVILAYIALLYGSIRNGFMMQMVKKWAKMSRH